MAQVRRIQQIVRCKYLQRIKLEFMNSPTLEDAIILAADQHRHSEPDKSGAPYILHPLRVLHFLGPHATAEERIVAVLHDVVEDCPISFDDLRALGYNETVIAALDGVTKRPEEFDDYAAFVRRAAQNPIARRVKRADLRDNMDLSRIAEPTEKDLQRMEKYQRAVEYLDALDD